MAHQNNTTLARQAQAPAYQPFGVLATYAEAVEICGGRPVVYVIWRLDQNTPVYVGKSERLSRRLSKHLRSARNPHLRNAIAKHGEANFRFDIVHLSGFTDLNALEMHLISFYGRADLGEGPLYNLSAGGDGLTSEDMKRAWDDPAYRENHRAAMADPVVREKRRAALVETWADPVVREKRLAAVAEALSDPVVREKRRTSLVETLSDPVVKAKRSIQHILGPRAKLTPEEVNALVPVRLALEVPAFRSVPNSIYQYRVGTARQTLSAALKALRQSNQLSEAA